MKKLLLLSLIIACGAPTKQPAPHIVPAGELNGRTLWMHIAPTQDDNEAEPVTVYDQQEITRWGRCIHGFKEVRVEYGPYSPDGISTKYLTFYCY